MNQLLILTGLSGAGRSTAATVLEEENYRVIDNLPSELSEHFIDLILKDGTDKYKKTAITVNILDVRTLLEKLEYVNEKIDVKLILLTADKDEILSRYKLTRHVHPLQSRGYSLHEALSAEMNEETQLRDRADYFIDTTGKTASDLRGLMFQIISQNENIFHLTTVVFTSFGFKYGLPMDADVIFDVRMVPNPYYIEELRPYNGLEQPIIDFMMDQTQAEQVEEQIKQYLEFYLSSYIKEARGLISIAIGCSGGQHRSVYIVEQLKKHFKDIGYRAISLHRDIKRDRGV